MLLVKENSTRLAGLETRSVGSQTSFEGGTTSVGSQSSFFLQTWEPCSYGLNSRGVSAGIATFAAPNWLHH